MIEATGGKRWLKVQAVAERYQVRPNTVYSWIRERKIPHHKMGRLVRFEEGELEEWEQKGSVGTKNGARR